MEDAESLVSKSSTDALYFSTTCFQVFLVFWFWSLGYWPKRDLRNHVRSSVRSSVRLSMMQFPENPSFIFLKFVSYVEHGLGKKFSNGFLKNLNLL